VWFNSNEPEHSDQLDPYIQDAMDLIRLPTGPVTVNGENCAPRWDAAPFHLKMMGVGNEQWGPQFIERYDVFSKALKSKHPEITYLLTRAELKRRKI
jgi:alpha-L-arabinofuranosidase